MGRIMPAHRNMGLARRTVTIPRDHKKVCPIIKFRHLRWNLYGEDG